MNRLPPRLAAKIEPEPNSGCWLWAAHVTSDGYAMVKWNGKMRIAHRVIYSLAVGPISPGKTLDHHCRVRPCVNPSHLQPMSQGENTLAPGSHSITKLQRDQTHCKRGHSLADAYVWHRQRKCRTCARRPRGSA